MNNIKVYINLPALPFSTILKIQRFQGLTCTLGLAVYAHSTRTGVIICAGFNQVDQLFVYPVFHVRSFSMSMSEINNILELLIQNFVRVVLFLWRPPSFAIFWSIWLCNISFAFLWGLSELTSLIYLFCFCHFLQCNEVWVQFIYLRWVLQDIGLLLYIHCVYIRNDHLFFGFYCYVFQ